MSNQSYGNTGDERAGRGKGALDLPLPGCFPGCEILDQSVVDRCGKAFHYYRDVWKTVADNEQRARAMIERTGHTADVGMELMGVFPGSAFCRISLGDRHRNRLGIVHGGILYSLADTTAGLAAASLGQGGTTVEGRMEYMRPAAGENLYCRGSVIKYGKSLIWADADLMDESGQLLCRGHFLYNQLDLEEVDGVMRNRFGMAALPFYKELFSEVIV